MQNVLLALRVKFMSWIIIIDFRIKVRKEKGGEV